MRPSTDVSVVSCFTFSGTPHRASLAQSRRGGTDKNEEKDVSRVGKSLVSLDQASGYFQNLVGFS